MKTWIDSIIAFKKEEAAKRASGLRKFTVTTNDRRRAALTVWLKSSRDYDCGFAPGYINTCVNRDGEEATAFFNAATNTGAYVLVKEVTK